MFNLIKKKLNKYPRSIITKASEMQSMTTTIYCVFARNAPQFGHKNKYNSNNTKRQNSNKETVHIVILLDELWPTRRPTAVCYKQ